MKRLSILTLTLLFLICSAFTLMAGCSEEQSEGDQNGSVSVSVPSETGGSGSTKTDDSSSADSTSVDQTFTVTVEALKTTYQTVKKGEKATAPTDDPKKVGYVFEGWYLGDEVYDWDTPVTADITIKAKFVQSDFDIVHGVAYQKGNSYVAAAENTLIVMKNMTFSQGLLTATITPTTANDCAVVFGLDDDAGDFFWENEEYYVAMINKEGIFFLSKVGETAEPWKVIYSNDCFTSRYSATSEYRIDIYYKDGDCVIALNGEIVYSGQIGALMGSKIGYRSQKSETVFGKMTVDENGEPIESSAEKVGDFYVNHGKISAPANYTVAMTADTIGSWAGHTLENGEFSVNLSKNAAGTDDGIIFCLDDKGRASFWEDGVSYYFFFINLQGYPYLGKVDNGAWSALAVGSPYPESTLNFSLKVEIIGNYIQCYVNNEMVFAYSDSAKLTGKKVGLRAGGMTYYDSFAVEEKEIEVVPLEGYATVNGAYRAVDGRIQALAERSIAVKDNTSFTSGSFSAKVTANGDSGLVFGLDDKGKDAFMEEGVSYWDFYINRWGWAVLAKIENGVYGNVKESSLAATYAVGKEFKLKVVLTGGYAYCYVDDNLHIKYKLDLFGEKIAIRGDSGAQYTEVTVSDSTELITAQTLIFGHSYTDLWKPTYKQDFSEIEDILDIGIGGTQTVDWSRNVEEVATYNFETAIFMIGINDFGTWNPDITAQKVYEEIAKTIDGLHERLPKATFALININKVPWTEKVNYYNMIDQTNALLETYASTRDYVKLVDFASEVLNDDGSFKDYFVPDQLHLNAKGYAALTKLVKKALGIAE